MLSTSIKKTEDKKIAILYPNPTQDILNIKLTNQEVYSVSIFDVFGNPINIHPTINNELIIYNTQTLNQGLYLINIIHNNISTSHKFQIIR